MKFPAIALLALSLNLPCTRAEMWGGDWGFVPSCAGSCFSSTNPMSSSDWASYCAMPVSVSNCISTACSSDHSALATASSIQSSMCSAYSSCSSMTQSCSDWPFSGQQGMGWVSMGDNGWYTITGSDGYTSGWSTRTVVVTSTASGTGAKATTTITTTQTATLVAAAAAAGTTTAVVKSSKTSNAAARRAIPMNSEGALIAAAFGAVIAI